MWANCTGWLVYAFLITDPYVLASNVPGLALAIFMTVTCYGFADDKARAYGLWLVACACALARSRSRLRAHLLFVKTRVVGVCVC
jgi:hypothetical protein